MPPIGAVRSSVRTLPLLLVLGQVGRQSVWHHWPGRIIRIVRRIAFVDRVRRPRWTHAVARVTPSIIRGHRKHRKGICACSGAGPAALSLAATDVQAQAHIREQWRRRQDRQRWRGPDELHGRAF